MAVRQMGVYGGGSDGNDKSGSRGQTSNSESLGMVTDKKASGASEVPLSDAWGKDTNTVRRDGVKQGA